MPTRLRAFVTHPIQYQVPIWRALATHPDVDLKVFYFNDQSIRGGLDREFGLPIAWDVDLQSGYEHEFLSRDAPLDRNRAMTIADLPTLLRRERPHWVFLAGYTYAFERQLMMAAHHHHSRLLMRAEFSELSETRRPALKRLIRHAYLRWFYHRVDRFCYPGEVARKHLASFGIDDACMFFSPYAVDDVFMEEQADKFERAEVRRELNVPETCFLFVFSGKLIPRKDPLAILDALERIPHSHIGLIVLGDGELRAELEPRARALLGSRFYFPGFVNQSQLSRYYRAADALLMPSAFETWGLVVNEAMHHGLPVIVSDRVGCHADLIRSDVTGYVYPCGRTDVLASMMASLASAPGKAAEMGRAARAHISRYTVSAAARGIIDAMTS